MEKYKKINYKKNLHSKPGGKKPPKRCENQRKKPRVWGENWRKKPPMFFFFIIIFFSNIVSEDRFLMLITG
ncbi:unnamed protein product [Blepharisma stoltei]|uniref:Uncharacterized protein n=1 Tax=Blepharisma stoltei TaxID=1481888 RepID=A0AAU9IV81_9CILI|nr:unnamed protein product [Blepharisma stoltei]